MVNDDDPPICWDKVGERKILGPELVQVTIEKI